MCSIRSRTNSMCPISIVHDVFMEAWDRGDAWQEALAASLRTFDKDAFAPVAEGLRESIERFEADPAKYGF